MKHYSFGTSLCTRQDYKFPNHNSGGQKRSFQLNWLDKYNGLTYSESTNGGYCLFCVLFGHCHSNPAMQQLGILINTPLTNFKKAIENLNKHFCSKSIGDGNDISCCKNESGSGH